mmetsp:Transcript_12943/g.27380  ORF Transcript_12943/g.27380 Transcript_12943/m.27380 type:complete len:173 (+) Transcript_12943:1176-1694(+)
MRWSREYETKQYGQTPLSRSPLQPRCAALIYILDGSGSRNVLEWQKCRCDAKNKKQCAIREIWEGGGTMRTMIGSSFTQLRPRNRSIVGLIPRHVRNDAESSSIASNCRHTTKKDDLCGWLVGWLVCLWLDSIQFAIQFDAIQFDSIARRHKMPMDRRRWFVRSCAPFAEQL